MTDATITLTAAGTLTATIAYQHIDTRAVLKSAGFRWNPAVQSWTGRFASTDAALAWVASIHNAEFRSLLDRRISRRLYLAAADVTNTALRPVIAQHRRMFSSVPMDDVARRLDEASSLRHGMTQYPGSRVLAANRAKATLYTVRRERGIVRDGATCARDINQGADRRYTLSA